MSKVAKERSGWFNRFAANMALVVGSPWAFLIAFASVVVWLASGPAFHWSDTWQLIISSVTNIVTYLVVFVIQNSQNRDSDAINLKLNELIAADRFASNELLNVEDMSDQDLDSLYARYENIRDEWERRQH